jgi:hypothetical protein
VAAEPDLELTVDLEAQVVHLPGDEDLPFEVDPFAKAMLLAGTDEMGWLLRQCPRSRPGRPPIRPGSTPGSAPTRAGPDAGLTPTGDAAILTR